MEENFPIRMISGLVLFSLSASILPLTSKKQNRLYFFLSHFCSDLHMRVMDMDSQSADTDSEVASPCSTGSTHGKAMTDSDEKRLHEMQRIFGYQQEFYTAPKIISRVDSSRYVSKCTYGLVSASL